MRIRIQPPKIIRIHADSDPQFRRKDRQPLKQKTRKEHKTKGTGRNCQTRDGPVGHTETRTTGQHKKVKEQKGAREHFRRTFQDVKNGRKC
jgi:hypothetical protein